ncbi:MAG: flagellar assembly protein FliW [Proteobacteria bacterium]|nr:flagellar assembly protein FliW [Pseudomonadota bacterium]
MAEIKMDKELINSEDKLTFQTQYGEVKLSEEKLISFENGIVGFSNCTVFGLANHPGAEESPILILQCVNDPEVNFAMIDYKSVNFEFAEADYLEAIKAADINAKDALLLLIIRGTENSDGIKSVLVNTKAPIVLDTTNKVAKQVILNNKELSTQQEL